MAMKLFPQIELHLLPQTRQSEVLALNRDFREDTRLYNEALRRNDVTVPGVC